MKHRRKLFTHDNAFNINEAFRMRYRIYVSNKAIKQKDERRCLAVIL